MEWLLSVEMGERFKVQGSGLARGAARPLILDESFARIKNVKLEIVVAAPPQI